MKLCVVNIHIFQVYLIKQNPLIDSEELYLFGVQIDGHAGFGFLSSEYGCLLMVYIHIFRIYLIRQIHLLNLFGVYVSGLCRFGYLRSKCVRLRMVYVHTF